VQVTVLVVFGRNELPEGGEEDMPAREQLSLALTVQVTMALVPQVVTTLSLGQTIAGGIVSRTVTVRTQVAELVQQFCAHQVWVMTLLQPAPLVALLSRLTVTPQHESMAAGGGGNGLPH
jgi:hypothetical protein